MSSPPKPGAKRQDSAVSSASSGNRTVRASSIGGKSRSSTSTSNAASPGFLTNWIGLRRPADDDDEVYEDGDVLGGYYLGNEVEASMSGSSTPMAARFAGRTGEEEDEAGPSDYWRRSPSPQGMLTTPPAVRRAGSLKDRPVLSQDHARVDWRPATSEDPSDQPMRYRNLDPDLDEKPDGMQTDDDVYIERLRLVRMDSPSLTNVALHIEADHDEGYFATSRSARSLEKSQRYVTGNQAGYGSRDDQGNHEKGNGGEPESVEFPAKVGYLCQLHESAATADSMQSDGVDREWSTSSASLKKGQNRLDMSSVIPDAKKRMSSLCELLNLTASRSDNYQTRFLAYVPIIALHLPQHSNPFLDRLLILAHRVISPRCP